jgi:hypothetical protein
MPEPDQQILNEAHAKAILRAISPDRFQTYLVAAGHDQVRAFKLYLWNAQLGEAFHVPIQAVEVGLRNCVNVGLTQQFGNEWWKNKTLEDILDAERKADLSVVSHRIRNRNLRLCTAQIVAGMSFGFWVGMLDGRYNKHIWSRHLRVAFPHFPDGRGRKSLFKTAGEIASLRNRISHHEPLISRDSSFDFNNVMTFMEWICPHTTAWIRPHCRVPLVLRQKP